MITLEECICLQLMFTEEDNILLSNKFNLFIKLRYIEVNTMNDKTASTFAEYLYEIFVESRKSQNDDFLG